MIVNYVCHKLMNLTSKRFHSIKLNITNVKILEITFIIIIYLLNNFKLVLYQSIYLIYKSIIVTLIHRYLILVFFSHYIVKIY